MAQAEQFVSHDARPANGPTRKDLYYPGLAIVVALAFAANAWFFYRQGRDEALNPDSAMPPATIAWTEPVSSPTATPAGDSGTDAPAATQQPAATDEAGKPTTDAASIDKPAAKRSVRAKPANRSMLAKASKPVAPSTMRLVDRGVALLSHPKPAYPLSALREREQGTVLVLAQVDVSGHVSDARVARRSGSTALDRAATNEVRRWQFEPALHNGQPIVASVQVPVSYRLQD